MSALQHVESPYGSSGFRDTVTIPEMMQWTAWRRKQLVQINGIPFKASCHAKKRISETESLRSGNENGGSQRKGGTSAALTQPYPQTIRAGSTARSPGIEPTCLRNSEQATHGLRRMVCDTASETTNSVNVVHQKLWSMY
ncbi:hypothetical protein EYZ11_011765 [Aspergillus tanneri]|uniref:Uncharacterized protein n=1 Tax=Aspergillus tanneri TaxID=1220188 RepID=A0A4S3J209_9EURO|nr:hypothetical protein EYZ11_011765 [Aspergillus tanneri]